MQKRKIFQINTVSNSGSTGRITEGIGSRCLNDGWESYIAYGRAGTPSRSITYKIGAKFDVYLHVLLTRLFDAHGLASKKATNYLINLLEEINPDIIHLHNIHGYFLNYPLLFDYLRKVQKPVVWTLHDCWSYTGHCAYYSYINCRKWETHCGNCPILDSYPKSFGYDRSFNNFSLKKQLFGSIENLTIVTPSFWLANEVKRSFFSSKYIKVIPNGIDLNQFRPTTEFNVIEKYNINKKYILLGVASIWEPRKGLQDFIELSKTLKNDEVIVLVGLSSQQLKLLPNGIIGIPRTESISELAELYSAATAFINPTYEDNFPTTNLESLACGTPVITYNTGGSPESISNDVGFVVSQGDILSIKNAFDKIKYNSSLNYLFTCRTKAVKFYDKLDRFQEYIDLYNNVLK